MSRQIYIYVIPQSEVHMDIVISDGCRTTIKLQAFVEMNWKYALTSLQKTCQPYSCCIYFWNSKSLKNETVYIFLHYILIKINVFLSFHTDFKRQYGNNENFENFSLNVKNDFLFSLAHFHYFSFQLAIWRQ